MSTLKTTNLKMTILRAILKWTILKMPILVQTNCLVKV